MFCNLEHQGAEEGAAPAAGGAAQNGAAKSEEAHAKGQDGSKADASGKDDEVRLVPRVQCYI
jgi:hypothetical protein